MSFDHLPQPNISSLHITSTLEASAPDPTLSSPIYWGSVELHAFHARYANLHGYLASSVCLFGIIANILNIVVLTRKSMISPTNCLLTGLAASDGLTMAAYLPFALRFYVLYGTNSTPERNSLQATRFMLFYACFSVVVHTASIWLTVTLTIFRYIFIKHPRHSAEWCSLSRAKTSIFLVYLVTLLFCIPNFFTYAVRSEQLSDWLPHSSISDTVNQSSAHISVHSAHQSDYAENGGDFKSELNLESEQQVIWYVGFKEDTNSEVALKVFNFWIQAILVKLLPCTGLTILSILLVKTLKAAEKHRQKLRAASNKSKEIDFSKNSRSRKTNRTTRMLLVVVALFLITEFPQGILNLLSGVLRTEFIMEIYNPLGDVMDLMALVNNGINFILYCTMSKQFRHTFIELFLCWRRSKKSQITGAEFTTVGHELRSVIEER